MTLLAATATHAGPLAWVFLAAAALLAVLVYAGSCWLWPFTHCARCSGGKVSRDDGRVFRMCRRCSGSGRRLRVGRRVWNWIADRRRAAP